LPLSEDILLHTSKLKRSKHHEAFEENGKDQIRSYSFTRSLGSCGRLYCYSVYML